MEVPDVHPPNRGRGRGRARGRGRGFDHQRRQHLANAAARYHRNPPPNRPYPDRAAGDLDVGQGDGPRAPTELDEIKVDSARVALAAARVQFAQADATWQAKAATLAHDAAAAQAGVALGDSFDGTGRPPTILRGPVGGPNIDRFTDRNLYLTDAAWKRYKYVSCGLPNSFWLRLLYFTALSFLVVILCCLGGAGVFAVGRLAFAVFATELSWLICLPAVYYVATHLRPHYSTMRDYLLDQFTYTEEVDLPLGIVEPVVAKWFSLGHRPEHSKLDYENTCRMCLLLTENLNVDPALIPRITHYAPIVAYQMWQSELNKCSHNGLFSRLVAPTFVRHHYQEEVFMTQRDLAPGFRRLNNVPDDRGGRLCRYFNVVLYWFESDHPVLEFACHLLSPILEEWLKWSVFLILLGYSAQLRGESISMDNINCNPVAMVTAQFSIYILCGSIVALFETATPVGYAVHSFVHAVIMACGWIMGSTMTLELQHGQVPYKWWCTTFSVEPAGLAANLSKVLSLIDTDCSTMCARAGDIFNAAVFWAIMCHWLLNFCLIILNSAFRLARIPNIGYYNVLLAPTRVLWKGVPVLARALRNSASFDVTLRPGAKISMPSPSQTQPRWYKTPHTDLRVGYGVEGYEPFGFSANLHNEVECLKARVLKAPPAFDLVKMTKFIRFVKDNLDDLFPGWRKVEPADFEAYVRNSNASPGVKRILRQAKEELDAQGINEHTVLGAKRTHEWTKRKSFVKVEANCYTSPLGDLEKAPRLIQGLKTLFFLAICGPYFMALQGHMKKWWGPKHMIYFTSGASASRTARYLAECEGWAMLEDDISAYDSSISVPLCWLEVWLAKKFGAPRAVLDLMIANISTHGATMHGVRYRCPGTRKSGDPYTSLFNSVLNGLMHVFIFCEHTGMTAKEARHFLRMLVQGDDNALRHASKFGQIPFKQGMADLGFKADAIYRSHLSKLEFCSSRILPSREGYQFAPKIGRVLAKFGAFINAPQNVHPFSVIKGVCLGLMPACGHHPLLFSFLTGVLTHLTSYVEYRVKTFDFRMVYHTHHPVEETYHWLGDLYSYSPSQLIAMERYLYKLPFLARITNPHVQVLADRDCAGPPFWPHPL